MYNRLYFFYLVHELILLLGDSPKHRCSWLYFLLIVENEVLGNRQTQLKNKIVANAKTAYSISEGFLMYNCIRIIVLTKPKTIEDELAPLIFCTFASLHFIYVGGVPVTQDHSEHISVTAVFSFFNLYCLSFVMPDNR